MSTRSTDGSDVVLVKPTMLEGESHEDFVGRMLRYNDSLERQKETETRARLALRQAACPVQGEIGNHLMIGTHRQYT